MYLKLERRVNFKSPKCLDLLGWHGNYQPTRSAAAVKAYCTKEGNYLTNLDVTTLTKPNIWLEARTLAKDQSLRDAVAYLEKSPQGAMQLTLNGDRIMKSFQALRRKELTVTHPLTSFQLPSTEWNRDLSLILSGLTGTGKTALAKALMPKALMINHIDRLREYNDTYEGVIFDDMDFHHYPRESHIHLVDTYEERDIHGRNVNGRLPAGTPRIFTTNRQPRDILLLSDPAVARRCCAWLVVAPDDIAEIVIQ